MLREGLVPFFLAVGVCAVAPGSLLHLFGRDPVSFPVVVHFSVVGASALAAMLTALLLTAVGAPG